MAVSSGCEYRLAAARIISWPMAVHNTATLSDGQSFGAGAVFTPTAMLLTTAASRHRYSGWRAGEPLTSSASFLCIRRLQV